MFTESDSELLGKWHFVIVEKRSHLFYSAESGLVERLSQATWFCSAESAYGKIRLLQTGPTPRRYDVLRFTTEVPVKDGAT